MGQIVGIDLGTTFSAVGYLDQQGPRLIPNALGDVLTPSAVGFDTDGHLLVGRAAKELQVVQPERCVSAFKRYMGTDWTIELAGRRYLPEELSSLILKSLRQDAEAHFKGVVDRAVITVPAYFNEPQRQATMRAGQLAGLTVERILNEPTAAAIAYGAADAKAEKSLVVFDLGGGTFDVSVVEQFEGTLEVRASAGEVFLGGEDFTNALVARVLESKGLVFERVEAEAPRLVSRLRQECEQAKKRLSSCAETTVRLPNAQGEFPGQAPVITITRSDFERWTTHILNRIDIPIRRALGDAKLSKDDVHDLVLVGGATRMPQVVDRLKWLFGRDPVCRLNPDETVALGAAVQAGLIDRHEQVEELVVTDVAPFTLGIEIARDLASRIRDGYFMPIINRNTTIPVSRVERVYTIHNNQTYMEIRIYQGESRRVEGNLLLGKVTVQGIPRGPAGQAVDVRFTYDLNGVLEVEAVVVETQQKVMHVITRHARGMSDAELQRAIAAMNRLKTHPREEAVNRFLLRRAERVYQELPLGEREFLDRLLSAFEEALETQNEEEIVGMRLALEEFLNRVDSSGQDDHGDQ
ncbi:MAG: Hsp70 family protein [Planctomycetes bacterium]|nr:Hsp70 family protein [Planctomycetota bacterium]